MTQPNGLIPKKIIKHIFTKTRVLNTIKEAGLGYLILEDSAERLAGGVIKILSLTGEEVLVYFHPKKDELEIKNLSLSPLYTFQAKSLYMKLKNGWAFMRFCWCFYHHGANFAEFERFLAEDEKHFVPHKLKLI